MAKRNTSVRTRFKQSAKLGKKSRRKSKVSKKTQHTETLRAGLAVGIMLAVSPLMVFADGTTAAAECGPSICVEQRPMPPRHYAAAQTPAVTDAFSVDLFGSGLGGCNPFTLKQMHIVPAPAWLNLPMLYDTYAPPLFNHSYPVPC